MLGAALIGLEAIDLADDELARAEARLRAEIAAAAGIATPARTGERQSGGA